MHISVSETIELHHMNEFTSFSVVSELPLSAIDSRLRESTLGHADTTHAWISEPKLAAWGAKVSNDPGWLTQFADLVAFARSKGWYDEPSSTIRAHVVTSE